MLYWTKNMYVDTLLKCIIVYLYMTYDVIVKHLSLHFLEIMSGTILAEAGGHMEAVLEGRSPGGGVKQPEVECPGVHARELPVDGAELLVLGEVRVKKDDGAGGPCQNKNLNKHIDTKIY